MFVRLAGALCCRTALVGSPPATGRADGAVVGKPKTASSSWRGARNYLAARAHSRQIDAQLAEQKARQQDVLKILILGGPESGKSTLLKQMRILHMNGFSDLDLINYKYLIFNNLIQGIHQLIEAADLLRISIDIEVVADVRAIREFYLRTPPSEQELSLELTAQIRRVFSANFMGQLLQRHHEIELLDSAVYFLEGLERISAADYRPTHQDVLRSRIPTTGIIEMEFPYRKTILRMVDVGGQRSERRKWIHCFDNVNGILFVAEMSGYSQTLSDGNESMNRLKYSMKLYRQIISNKCFGSGTGFILFLNKVDIFSERLTVFPITVCFASYKGPPSYQASADYISDRFENLVPIELKRPTYTHFTNATDTQNVDRVFDACVEVVFKLSMERVGFL